METSLIFCWFILEKMIERYVPLLQKRNEWIVEKESHKEGYLVVLVDDQKLRKM